MLCYKHCSVSSFSLPSEVVNKSVSCFCFLKETSHTEKEVVTEQEMVRHGTVAEEPKPDENEEKEGWLSGWGIGGLPVLSEVVQKTTDIVQKTGSVVYQTVEKTTNAVS